MLIDVIMEEVLEAVEAGYGFKTNEWGDVVWWIPASTYSRLSMAIQMGKTSKYDARADFSAPIVILDEKVKVLVFPLYKDA